MAVIGFVLFVTHLVLCTFGARYALWIAAAAFMLFLSAAFVPKLRQQTVLICSLLTILAGCVSFYSAYAFRFLPLAQWDGQSVEIYAHLADFPTVTKAHEQVELRVDSIMGQPVRYRLLLTADELPVMSDSDGLVFKAKLRVRSTAAPSSSVWAYADCKADDIRVIPEPPSLPGRMLSVRRYTGDTLQRILGGTNGALLAGMLTGDSSLLPDRVYNSLRGCGILHLFAVSGFHLSVFSMALLRLISRKTVPPRFVSAAAALIVLFIMAMTGFSYSCIRAGVMILLMLLGFLIRRQADSLNSLGMALSLICFTDAFSASDVGLQLSVLGVLCIILVSPVVDKWTRHVRFRPRRMARIVRRFLSVVLVSAVIQVVTLPVTVPVFHQFAPLAPVVNGLVLPAAQTAMIFSAVTVLFSICKLFLPLFRLCGVISGLLAKYCVAVCRFFGRFSFTPTTDQSRLVCLWIAGTLIVCAVSIWIPMKSRRKMLVLSGISAVLLAVCVTCGVWNCFDTATITLPDVGNASAFLLQSRGKSALLGCGKRATSRKLSAFVSDLNLLLIPRVSETESDGCQRLLWSIPVRNVILPPGAETQTVIPGESACLISDFGKQRVGAFDITYICSDDVAAAYAEVYSVSVLFLFGAEKVPRQMPRAWYGADVVCARGGLPQSWSVDKIGWILLSSSRERGNLLAEQIRQSGGYVSATSENGDMCLRISSDGAMRLE